MTLNKTYVQTSHNSENNDKMTNKKNAEMMQLTQNPIAVRSDKLSQTQPYPLITLNG